MSARQGRKTGSLEPPPFDPGSLAHSLPEQVADQVAAAIVDGTFPPGHRLKEVALAASFGVSRAPVREALRILESQGLIQMLPQRGAQVTELTRSDVVELFQIRAVLLGLAARRVAERHDAKTLDELDAGVRALEDLAKKPRRIEEYRKTSYELSIAMAAASDSERLHRMVASFAQQTTRYTRLALSTPGRLKRSSTAWRKIHRALKKGDPSAAESYARNSVEETARVALARLGELREGPHR